MGDSRKKVAEYEVTLGELLLINPPPKVAPALCPLIFKYAVSKIIIKIRFFFILTLNPLSQT